MGHLVQFTTALALGLLAAFGSTANAQDTAQPAQGAISIELSSAEETGEGCKLSFVVTNGHDKDIAQAVFETVLFDDAGQVSRLTLLDFQNLPAGRLRVRQFQFPQACADISRLLINGAQTCSTAGLAEGACSQGLTVTSRTKIEVLG